MNQTVSAIFLVYCLCHTDSHMSSSLLIFKKYIYLFLGSFGHQDTIESQNGYESLVNAIDFLLHTYAVCFSIQLCWTEWISKIHWNTNMFINIYHFFFLRQSQWNDIELRLEMQSMSPNYTRMTYGLYTFSLPSFLIVDLDGGGCFSCTEKCQGLSRHWNFKNLNSPVVATAKLLMW